MQESSKVQIKNSNPWYTDDQFTIQLGSPSMRYVVENRWEIFECMIMEWGKKRYENDKSPIMILDAGCGDGINLKMLSEMFNRYNIENKLIGIDYNHLRIKKALKIKRVIVIEGSLLCVPFFDQTFDCILCNQVLEHIPQDYKVLKEFQRILKSKGKIILGVPNEGCLLGKIRNKFVQPKIKRTTDHVNFYTLNSILQKLQAANLNSYKYKIIGFFFPHTILSRLFGRFKIGRALGKLLNILFPSQASELIFNIDKTN